MSHTFSAQEISLSEKHPLIAAFDGIVNLPLRGISGVQLLIRQVMNMWLTNEYVRTGSTLYIAHQTHCGSKAFLMNDDGSVYLEQRDGEWKHPILKKNLARLATEWDVVVPMVDLQMAVQNFIADTQV